ncbi:hypothetical protein RM530_16460 [Algiphilus sp. W345]|uniref:Uncharacterized protein n=1 Tax=Banduia mediterranea TaxID=3075609 RepID=A0ABU2WNW9_9GAMM|nr:hypothetical protein [Algiphilus sp. W345]MDT0498939.1 hypothetical protein [Algiphilus sp. W345]
MAGGPNLDEARARRYAENSLTHFHWLVGEGLRYKNSYIAEHIVEPMTDDCLIRSGSEETWPFSPQAKPCPRGHTPEFMGMGAGCYLMDVLTRRVEQRISHTCRISEATWDCGPSTPDPVSPSAMKRTLPSLPPAPSPPTSALRPQALTANTMSSASIRKPSIRAIPQPRRNRETQFHFGGDQMTRTAAA